MATECVALSCQLEKAKQEQKAPKPKQKKKMSTSKTKKKLAKSNGFFLQKPTLPLRQLLLSVDKSLHPKMAQGLVSTFASSFSLFSTSCFGCAARLLQLRSAVTALLRVDSAQTVFIYNNYPCDNHLKRRHFSPLPFHPQFT